jgi:hypothetical protein
MRVHLADSPSVQVDPRCFPPHTALPAAVSAWNKISFTSFAFLTDPSAQEAFIETDAVFKNCAGLISPVKVASLRALRAAVEDGATEGCTMK